MQRAARTALSLRGGAARVAWLLPFVCRAGVQAVPLSKATHVLQDHGNNAAEDEKGSVY